MKQVRFRKRYRPNGIVEAVFSLGRISTYVLDGVSSTDIISVLILQTVRTTVLPLYAVTRSQHGSQYVIRSRAAWNERLEM